MPTLQAAPASNNSRRQTICPLSAARCNGETPYMSKTSTSAVYTKIKCRSEKTTMPAPHQSDFYEPDALPDTQPTASKHWRPTHENIHKKCRITLQPDIYSQSVNLHWFLPHELCLERYILWPCMCVSVTRRSSTKIAKCGMRETTLDDSQGTLVFCWQRSWRNSNEVTRTGVPMQVG